MFKNILILLFVFLFSLSLRLTYVHTTVLDTPLRGDAISYVTYAYNLVTVGIYSKEYSQTTPPTPDSYWAPGFPLMIALTMQLTDKEKSFYPTVILIQTVLGALLVVLVFFIGNHCLPNWATAIATLLTAVSPHLISFTGYFLTETLFGFVQLLAILTFYWATRTGKAGLFALSGILFGYSYLIKPVIFFLPLLLAGLAIFHHRRSCPTTSQFAPVKFTQLAIFLILFSLFWGGWSLRNLLSVPAQADNLTQSALVSFVQGTQPDFYEHWSSGSLTPGHLSPETDPANKTWPGMLKNFTPLVLADPLGYLTWYGLHKPYLLWGWDVLIGQGDIYVYPILKSLYTTSPVADASRVLMKWLHPFVLLITLLGLYPLLKSLARRQLEVLDIPVLFYLTLVYITVVYVILFVDGRYSVPFRPELYVCAVWSLTTLIPSSINKGIPR